MDSPAAFDGAAHPIISKAQIILFCKEPQAKNTGTRHDPDTAVIGPEILTGFHGAGRRRRYEMMDRMLKPKEEAKILLKHSLTVPL